MNTLQQSLISKPDQLKQFLCGRSAGPNLSLVFNKELNISTASDSEGSWELAVDTPDEHHVTLRVMVVT